MDPRKKPSVPVIGALLAAGVLLGGARPAGETKASTGGAPADTVAFIEAAQVKAAFQRGTPLIETPSYKIHASRREAPGKVEIHTRDTDILYVLEGQATIVTGGVMSGGKTIQPDEIRGDSIAGGESRRLVTGDVMVIPNGVPHWFTQVEAPFLYYVVKVTAPAGGVR